MSNPRMKIGVALCNDLLYAIGGCTGNKNIYLKSVEQYDPFKDTWLPIADMNHSRAEPGVGVKNDKIYVIGGINDSGLLNSGEVYDVKSSTWTLVCRINIVPLIIQENKIKYSNFQ